MLKYLSNTPETNIILTLTLYKKTMRYACWGSVADEKTGFEKKKKRVQIGKGCHEEDLDSQARIEGRNREDFDSMTKEV